MILLSIIYGLYGNIPVFLNLKAMFSRVKACCQKGQKTLQKARLDILTIPRLLDNKRFKPVVRGD